MRTTLNIDDELMRKVKDRARETNQTITKIIESALRYLFSGHESGSKKRRFKLRWITVRGRLLPGVDISDRDSLYERMEDRS